jgi:hypothetical protein
MCRLFVAILLEAVLSVPVFAQDINNPEATGLALRRLRPAQRPSTPRSLLRPT